MSDDNNRPVTGPDWSYRHNYNTRICHWINAVAIAFLVVSGVHIFLDFPELYWGEVGFQGHEAVFRSSDIGLSWDEAGELGNRQWGRNYHFLFVWVFVLNGVVYLVWNAVQRRYWNKMLPSPDELRPSSLKSDLALHLRFRVDRHKQAQGYNTLQKITYLLVIFVLFPFMFLTGLAQMPAFNAIAPGLIEFFGGRQTARTLHAVGMLLILGFVVVHVLQVFLAGAGNEIRAMVTGWYRRPESRGNGR